MSKNFRRYYRLIAGGIIAFNLLVSAIAALVSKVELAAVSLGVLAIIIFEVVLLYLVFSQERPIVNSKTHGAKENSPMPMVASSPKYPLPLRIVSLIGFTATPMVILLIVLLFQPVQQIINFAIHGSPTPTYTPTYTMTPTFTPTNTPTAILTATNAIAPLTTSTPTQTAILSPTVTLTSTQPSAIVTPFIIYDMASISGGFFTQGSSPSDIQSFDELCKKNNARCTASNFNDEKPQRRVYLSSYWIDVYEVTNKQFQSFIASSGYVTSAERNKYGLVWDDSQHILVKLPNTDWKHPDGPQTGIAGLSDYPVVQVSWADAQAFCTWANKRLPTEAEWEKAARGEDSLIFSWGNQWDSMRGVFSGEYASGLVAVDSVPQGASPFGVQNMLGNVSEWVADWYDENYYWVAPTRNPQGPSSSPIGERVRRGGSRATRPGWLHTAWRASSSPDTTSNLVGFRCAKDP